MRVKKQYSLGPNPPLFKQINIGAWNMDGTAAVDVVHGLTLTNIRRVTAFIINDTSANLYAIEYSDNHATQDGKLVVDATNVVLSRRNAGFFDHGDFDHATMNRGYVIVEYA